MRPGRALVQLGTGLFLCGALLGVPREAAAEEPTGPAPSALDDARVKFQRAVELEFASDFSGALKLLREVAAVKMTPQVRYHIATCEEQLGQLVVALGGYEIALDQAPADTPPAVLADLRAAIAGLRARIPKLVLRRGTGAEAAVIELDQVKLGEGSLGVEIPVDPGPHTLVAKAAGFTDYSRTVTVREGQTEELRVELVPLPKTKEPEPQVGQGYGPWPFILGGVGVAGLAGAAVLLPVSQGKANELEALCGGLDCRGQLNEAEWIEADALLSDARLLETMGWISGGVGVASLTAGIVLFLLEPAPAETAKPKPAARSPLGQTALVPRAPDSQLGLSVVGKF